MLGAGLKREFPGASAWLARITSRAPRPRVARSALGWAVLAGLGSQALVAATLGFLVAVVLAFVELPRDWRDPFAVRSAILTVVSTGVGAAVARRSGGWAALGAFGMALALFAAVDAAVREPGRALFCERMGGGADIPLCAPRTVIDEVRDRWPAIAGIVAGLLVARRVGDAGTGANAAHEAVGIVAALDPLTRVAAAASLVPGAGFSVTHLAAMAALQLLTAAIGGHVLARRGGRGWRTAATLAAAYYAVPLLTSVTFFIRYPAATPPAEYAWYVAAPAAYAAAFVVAALVTAALARSRPPGADAARRAPR